MAMFADGEFDAVIASHVLEHLPVPYLDRALGEIARVGRHALVYLPVAGRHGQLNFTLGFKDINISVVWDVFNYFRKPDGITPAYCGKQHFWELGLRGYRVKDLKERMSHDSK
jgi:SAM-dependent methyltransferase